MKGALLFAVSIASIGASLLALHWDASGASLGFGTLAGIAVGGLIFEDAL